MKITSHARAIAARLGLAMALLVFPSAPVGARRGFDSFYLYMSDHPSEDNNEEADWSPEAQGLAHDDDNWYLTEAEGNVAVAAVWKVPVSHDLAVLHASDPDVLYRRLVDYAELKSIYDHFGDPVCYRGFLIVPAFGEHDSGTVRALILFHTSDLSVAHVESLGEEAYAYLVAVDPEGNIYYPADAPGSTHGLVRRSVTWDQFIQGGAFELGPMEAIPLYREDGSLLDLGQNFQGGEFSPGGELFYMSTGSGCKEEVSGGIHVFDTTTWRRVQHSTNGHGYFNYEWHCGSWEEPEGLTVWDLDDGLAPGISGQLHVIMLDNDVVDDVVVKHYTASISVDRSSPMPIEIGTPWFPFKTVGAAHGFAWDGAQLRIAAGAYPEKLVLSRRVRVTAHGGSVRIGK